MFRVRIANSWLWNKNGGLPLSDFCGNWRVRSSSAECFGITFGGTDPSYEQPHFLGGAGCIELIDTDEMEVNNG